MPGSKRLLIGRAVLALRTASSSRRTACALLLALLLAFRLLSPAGFMPAFEHGQLTIVACPDAAPAAGSASDHHGKHSPKVHAPCPFASAPPVGAFDPALPLAATPLAASVVVLLAGRSFPFVGRKRADPPPLRGPPLSV